MGKIFGGSKPQPTPVPTAKPVDEGGPTTVRVPTEQDPDIMLGKRRRVQEAFSQRNGRRSTALSQTSAGTAYTRTTMG